MDEQYLVVAVRYVEMNPVRAGIVQEPQMYRWSSALAHMQGKDDELVDVSPMLEMVRDWGEFLRGDSAAEDVTTLRRFQLTGRPLGSTSFIEELEVKLGRTLKRTKPGPKVTNNNK
jgi:putative transposase